MKIHVVITPLLIDKKDLDGRISAVIDVLRCTSSIITALINGAKGVYPSISIEEAKRKAVAQGEAMFLLGGEDKGKQIQGFDLGNSPLEYVNQKVVSGKILITYTSNGTGTIRKTFDASGRNIYIASLINVSAVASAIIQASSNEKNSEVVIVCSGRYGHPSAEDLLCAGLLILRIIERVSNTGVTVQLTDSAVIATDFAKNKWENSIDVLAASDHGVFLKAIGFSNDLEFVSQIDIYDSVPIFDGSLITLKRS